MDTKKFLQCLIAHTEMNGSETTVSDMSTETQTFSLKFKGAPSMTSASPEEFIKKVLAYVEINPGIVLTSVTAGLGIFEVKFLASRRQSVKKSPKRDLFDYE